MLKALGWLKKIKIWNGTYTADVTSENKLKVEATLPDDTPNVVQIRDGTGNEYLARVDDTGRLFVTSNVIPPPATTPAVVVEYGIVSGTDDSFYVIPLGETLTITRFSGGGSASNEGNVIELYYAPNGDTTGLILIAAIFCNGNSSNEDLSINYSGDGTAAILLRRKRLGGGSKDIYGRWEGYY